MATAVASSSSSSSSFLSSFVRPISTAAIAAKPILFINYQKTHLHTSIGKRSTLFSSFSPLLSSQSISASPFSSPPKALTHSISSPLEISLEDEDEDEDDDDGAEDFENGSEEADLQLEQEEEDAEEEVGGAVEEEEIGVAVSRKPVAKDGVQVPNLTMKEKKELASYAHGLGKKLKSQSVGKSGVTDGLAISFVETLEANELLKIKIHRTCPGELEDVVQKLEEGTGSVVVSKIGRTVIIYRPSLTRMKAEEQKRQARRVFVKKEFKTKPSLPGQQTRFYGHGHGYSRQGSRRAKV